MKNFSTRVCKKVFSSSSTLGGAAPNTAGNSASARFGLHAFQEAASGRSFSTITRRLLPSRETGGKMLMGGTLWAAGEVLTQLVTTAPGLATADTVEDTDMKAGVARRTIGLQNTKNTASFSTEDGVEELELLRDEGSEQERTLVHQEELRRELQRGGTTSTILSSPVSFLQNMNIDLTRIGHSFLVGGCLFTPLANFWYVRADKLFPVAMGANVWSGILKKVAFDQSVFTLTVLTTVFSAFSLLQGKTVQDACKKVVQEVPSTLPMNWAVWGPVQACNFLLLQPHQRIYLVNLVTVPWTGYLAYKSR
ncbi:unnamed protein product [Amoebophrya sp. A120]|nr:unnamed protein product [Amoebophrya sp. A120]|eukprot:GSA120T00025355001.1